MKFICLLIASICVNISVQQLYPSPGVGCFWCVWYSLTPMCQTVPPVSGISVIYLVPYVTLLYKRYEQPVQFYEYNRLWHTFYFVVYMYICISVWLFYWCTSIIYLLCFMIYVQHLLSLFSFIELTVYIPLCQWVHK